MMRVRYLILSLFLLSGLLSAGVTASWANPVDQKILFTKTTGLAPDTYTFRFSLWNVSSGGVEAVNRVWWEEKIITLTTNTLATFLGGVATPAKRSGILGNVDFSEQYWVQVERLEADGVTFRAVGVRTKFNVVPYAMWSETAGSGGSVISVTAGNGLTGVEAAGDITLNIGAGPGISVGADSIAIATGGVSSSMLAAGAVGNAQLANGAVTFSKLGQVCPNGFFPKFVTGTGWTCDPGSGAPGADGKTILNGTVNPTGLIGKDGDFFINTTSNTIFGPKVGGVWPAGVSMIGPPVTTSAICVNATASFNGVCTCERTTISKVSSISGCSITSDTGSCSAQGNPTFGRSGSCCVCAF